MTPVSKTWADEAILRMFSVGEAELNGEFDEQLTEMLAGARRTRAQLVQERELAHKSGDPDRALVCTYYITEADGLISLINHVTDTTLLHAVS
jgi:hypothetical protein